MTFIPQQQEKHCFIACSEDKVNAGLCDCINRMRNQALPQPLVSGSLQDRLFELANDFAVAKKGEVAVKLHSIHNGLQ